MNKNIFLVSHPLIKQRLSTLRDKTTSLCEFRTNMHDLSLLLIYEATKNLQTITKTIQTPLQSVVTELIADPQPVVIPILRAGLGMLNAFLQLFPHARVGLIGLKRNETTFISEEYYFNIPENTANHPVFIIDPMLATGGSAIAAVTRLKNLNIHNISLINIITAPEGLKNFQKKFPEIPTYVSVIDAGLNPHNFIVPGLGDAGDRLFGT